MSFSQDAAILLWKLNDNKEPEQTPTFQEDEDDQLNKESWSVVKTLRSYFIYFLFLKMSPLTVFYIKNGMK